MEKTHVSISLEKMEKDIRIIHHFLSRRCRSETSIVHFDRKEAEMFLEEVEILREWAEEILKIAE